MLSKYFSLIIMVLLLAGCSYHGIMPEQYDGEALNVDAEAVEKYVQTGEVHNINIARYPFIESDDIIEVPPFEDGDAANIEPGTYHVPDDFEPGLYAVETSPDVSSSALVVYDSDGVNILETSLIRDNKRAYILLNEGYTFEFKTRWGELIVTPVDTVQLIESEAGEILPPGIYAVGDMIDSGQYELVTEELLIMRKDGAPEVYWNSYGASFEYNMEQTMSTDYRPEEVDALERKVHVELEVGDVVIAQKVTGIIAR